MNDNLHDIEKTLEFVSDELTSCAADMKSQPVPDYKTHQEQITMKQLAISTPGLDDYKNSLKTEGTEIMWLGEDKFVKPPGALSEAKKEIQALENKQIRKRKQYEADRAFFEQNVLQKSRSIGEIQEDYIKILHPTYREKFIAGIEKYGTIAAALKNMKDVYGLKVRSDLLNRMMLMIPALKVEIEDALSMYQASLQMAMHQRAVEGVDKIIRDRDGNEIDREKVYSDTLLAKLADTYNPEFKEAKQKESSRGNTINVQIIKDFHNYKEKK